MQRITLETALSGGAPRVSQIRQQQQLQLAAAGGVHMGGADGAGRYNPTQQYAGGAGSAARRCSGVP